MFEVADRDALRERLVQAAEQDPQVRAAALVGSAARGAEDRWSDIDLALRLAPGVAPVEVADRWTAGLRRTEAVVDQLDVPASGALYRVLLLASTLQVDLSFWPYEHFLVGGPPVRLLFGERDERVADAGADPHAAADGLELVRTGWLHALHVRSALRRERPWQAAWMLEGLRRQLVALQCARHGLPGREGRGIDALPPDVRHELARTLLPSLDPGELHRVFVELVRQLLAEAARQQLTLPEGLEHALSEILRSAAPT